MKRIAFALLVLTTGCGAKTGVELVDPIVGTLDGSTDSAVDGSTDTAVVDTGVDSAIKPSPNQHILFEVSSVNFAWGNNCTGAYITSEGKVYSYDYFGTTPDAAVPYLELVPEMTEAQVTGKYGSTPKLLGSIDQTELLSNFAQVGEARRGMLLKQSSCADYGTDRFVGYTYNDTTSKYTPVILGMVGDVAERNTSSVADGLMKWLLTKAQLTESQACVFSTRSCEGSLCPGVAACTQGEVPIFPSDTGCLQKCGFPSHCDSVSDCSVCTNAGEACLIDPNGIRHCEGWITDCAGTIECACGANSICAGGTGYCHGTASEGLSCSAP
jgi:hypothetical protein